MKRLLLVLFLLAAAGVRAQFSGVTADLRITQNQLLPAEDMQVKVRVINRSGQPITLGQDDNWIKFLIVCDDGSVARTTAAIPAKGIFTLRSGQSGTRTFDPTPYFNFEKPGHYQISAVIHIAQWNQDISAGKAAFFVENGVALPNLANVPVGVPPPPGVTNMPPRVHFYSLVRVAYADQEKLYFRVSDDAGKILSVFPLARLLSFSEPEAQVDRGNNIHVLFQTGARDFSYFVMDANGHLLARQVYENVGRRPTLRFTEDGLIYVGNGLRRYTEMDLPSPQAVTRQ